MRSLQYSPDENIRTSNATYGRFARALYHDDAR